MALNANLCLTLQSDSDTSISFYCSFSFIFQPPQPWFVEILQGALRHVYQRALIEDQVDVYTSIYKVSARVRVVFIGRLSGTCTCAALYMYICICKHVT